AYLGTYPPTLSTLTAGPYIVGLYYVAVIETLPPVVDDEKGAASCDMMRIVECYAHVIGAQRFQGNGYTLSAYQVSHEVDQPPPEKNGPQKFNFLGWRREPTIVFNQPDPLPLDVLAVRTTVAF